MNPVKLNHIEHGDALACLRELPDESVHCCVTSPPYWGLRDYGVDGQLGLEKTPDEYVAKMVEVFHEVRRVLRKDGTLWLNLGDSYNAAGRDGHGTRVGYKQNTNRASGSGKDNVRPSDGSLKPKDLIGIPWRVAFALQADGWWLRQDIIWHKPNPMPESVRDRCTKSHEYIFMLSKSARYYYDADAIKEISIYGDPRKPYCPGQVDNRGDGHDRDGGKIRPSVKRGDFNGKTNILDGREAFRAITDYRNKRSVWTVATAPFKEAHFATFPPDLITPCILAGCPDGGVVLDPFGGSGTTAEVSLKTGRKFYLIELNADYITLAQKRIRHLIAQGVLF